MEHILKFTLILSICLVFLECRNNPNKTTLQNTVHSDIVFVGQKISDTDFVQVDLQKEILKYIKTYTDTIKIDTTIKTNGKETQVYFEYYCTFDSSINLPRKYVGIYGINNFITHNFISKLKIITGKEIVLDTFITKENFKHEIFEEEKLYGVLQFPKIHFFTNDIKIEYSISIPLTDIGVRTALECSYVGEVKIE